MAISIPDTHTNIVSWDTRSFAHVATVGPKGEPHSSPLWFEWDGTYLIFTIDEESQRTKNLRRTPHVAVSVIDPNDPYRYLEFRGQVQTIEADTDDAFLNRLSEKYLDVDVYPWKKSWEILIVVKMLPNKMFGAG
jgi:PPOX class probable F420-dependent enzyme